MPAKSTQPASQPKNASASSKLPVKTFHLSRIKAAVWENEADQKKFYNVIFARISVDDARNYHDTDSFGRDDLPLVAKLADQAHTFIFEQLAKLKAEQSEYPPRALGGREIPAAFLCSSFLPRSQPLKPVTILLCILQFLLALHTAMGAIWKFSHSAQTVPSLRALPQSVWLGMGVVELVCSAGLILPLFIKSWGQLAPYGALAIAAEMLLFCGLHLRSGESQHGHLVYWLIVAAICAFIAYSRLIYKPL